MGSGGRGCAVTSENVYILPSGHDTILLKKKKKIFIVHCKNMKNNEMNAPFVKIVFYDCFISLSKNNYFSFLDSWKDTWVYSKHPGKEFGKFIRTAGKFYNDEEADKGNFFLKLDFLLQTMVFV